MQRYSRFSRPTYEEILPPAPPDAPSLTDITMRALNGHYESIPASMPEENGHIEKQRRDWDQPPPPEPSGFWSEDEPAPRDPRLGQQRAQFETYREPAPAPPLPNETHLTSEAEIEQLPREPEPALAPVMRDRLAERTAARAVKSSGHTGNHNVVAEEIYPQHQQAENKPAKKRLSPALKKSVTAVRTKAGPALTKSALWLAHNLHRREIRKRYNRALVFGHTRIADRKLEQLFFVPTRKAEMINPAIDRGIHYDGPVPAKVFTWLVKLMPSDLREYAFVDIRAGRGRTTLLAAKRDFNRIISFEYDPEIFDDLQMNVAQFPRSQMICRNIDCYRGDVDGIRLPDQPCIIYFSGAWREPVLAGAIDYIRDTYRQSPRRIYIILENTDQATDVGSDTIFEPIEPPLAERLKLRLFSPMDFKIYRSVI